MAGLVPVFVHLNHFPCVTVCLASLTARKAKHMLIQQKISTTIFQLKFPADIVSRSAWILAFPIEYAVIQSLIDGIWKGLIFTRICTFRGANSNYSPLKLTLLPKF